MSDESGLINVEDDGPEPVAAVVPSVAEPVAPVPVVAGADEPDAIEINGEKRVPLAAVLSERKRAQAAEAEVARLKQFEQYANDTRPYVEFLKANPHLTTRQADPVAPAAPEADPDALEAAQLMDFYTPEGKPDAARGAKWLALQERRSQKIANAAVLPYAQSNAQKDSDLNFQRALALKDTEGRTPNPQLLRSVWSQMTHEQLANPAIAGIMAGLAFGLERMYQKPAIAAPSKPPLETEASGGQPRASVKLSGFEQALAASRGMKETQWAENTKNYTKGRPTVIEDE